MGDEAEKLRGALRRYRFLLNGTLDPEVMRILQQLIAEAQQRLGETDAALDPSQLHVLRKTLAPAPERA